MESRRAAPSVSVTASGTMDYRAAVAANTPDANQSALLHKLLVRSRL
jgi:hypothetical protein